VISFPNCKINLGLQITGKRHDGYHDLETIFYPVPFKDALELIPSKNNKSEIEFTSTGLAVDGKWEDNLCIKAYHLLKTDFSHLPTINIHLHKAIPMGAGLGGGSADAAFMLQLLNNKFKLNLSVKQLLNYALQLGSDCPFFIINKPCYASGRGEVLEEITVDLSTYNIVLVNPNIHINTGWAFSNTTLVPPKKSIKDIIQQPIETWKQELQNDFEPTVFKVYPQIQKIKETLYNQGAMYAAISGSGSTIFGIFGKEKDPPSFINKNYFIKTIN